VLVSKLNRIYLFVFFSFVILASVLVYFKLEWVEKKTDLGPTAEVKRQHFFAAQRFLQNSDVSLIIEQGYTRLDSPLLNDDSYQDVINADDLKVLPPTEDLIVISNGYGALSELRSKKLLDWVKAGGGLVVTATNPFLSSIEKRSDYIFDHFEVTPIDIEYLGEADEVKDKNDNKAVDNDATESSNDDLLESEVSLINTAEDSLETSEFKKWNPQQLCYLLNDSVPLTVYNEIQIAIGFDSNRALSFEEGKEDDFTFWSSNSQGIQIIQTNYGDGAVTFISDTSLWNNDYIGCLNNAYFLRFFVGGTQQIWLFDNQDSPSLIVLVWDNFPYFLISLMAFIGLIVWHFGQRFGAVAPMKSLNRRKILEHIEASALFLWRYKSSRWLLVETVQHSVRKKMKLRNANFDDKTMDQQLEMIARIAQLPIEEIKASMFEMTDEVKTQTLNEQNFIILMKSLKRIEGKL
jgi:hypothetical protein